MLIANMPPFKMGDFNNGPVPPATYAVRIHKSGFVEKPKSNDANPYIPLSFRIIGPDGDPSIGRMLFENCPLEGNGRFRLDELLFVTGHDPASFVLRDPGELLGLELRVLVVVEEGTNGFPPKAVIKKHLPPL